MSDAPFDNCKYKVCDLPGQCRAEGKCHHPESQRNAELEAENAKLREEVDRGRKNYKSLVKAVHIQRIGGPKINDPLIKLNAELEAENAALQKAIEFLPDEMTTVSEGYYGDGWNDCLRTIKQHRYDAAIAKENSDG